MKIRAEHFRNAIKDLGHITGGRTTLPILSCIKLEATGDRLTLTATDLDQWMKLSIPAEGSMAPATAATCVSARALLAAALTARDAIELRLSKSALNVSGGFTAAIPTLDPEEFPAEPDNPGTAAVTIPDLARRIEKVRHAMAPGADGKANLECVHVQYRAGQSCVECTDGRRMACSQINAEQHPEFSIPAHGIKALAKWGDHATALQLSANHLALEGELGGMEFSLMIRLLDLKYPNAAALLNQPSEPLGEINAPILLELITAAARFADENALIDLTFGPDGVEATAQGPEGKFCQTLPGEFPALELRISHKYLADSLNQCGQLITLKHQPAPGTRLDLHDGALTQLIMGARKA